MKIPPIEKLPLAIYNQSLKVIELKSKLSTLTQDLEEFDAEIEIIVASDDNLKNESQRKAKKLALRLQDEYKDLVFLSESLKIEIQKESAYLKLLEDSLSVKKILASSTR